MFSLKGETLCLHSTEATSDTSFYFGSSPSIKHLVSLHSTNVNKLNYVRTYNHVEGGEGFKCVSIFEAEQTELKSHYACANNNRMCFTSLIKKG